METAIEMTEIRTKLRDLPIHLLKQPSIVYQFALALAAYLNEELTPGGFLVAATLLLSDIHNRCKDSYNPIPAGLHNLSLFEQALLRMKLPSIIEAVCPPEFARQVIKHKNEVDEELRK